MWNPKITWEASHSIRGAGQVQAGAARMHNPCGAAASCGRRIQPRGAPLGTPHRAHQHALRLLLYQLEHGGPERETTGQEQA